MTQSLNRKQKPAEIRYKKYIDRFIINAYPILNRLSISNCKNTYYDPNDLLNELVQYLYTNQHKIMVEKKLIPNLNTLQKNNWGKGSKLIRWCNTWMWNQSNFYKPNCQLSNFSSKFYYIDHDYSKGKVFYESSQNEYNPFEAESEYITDLKSIYTDDQIDKIIFSKEIYFKLDQVEQKLYHYYFEKDLPHYIISKLIVDGNGKSVSASSIYLLIVKLRKKIKYLYESRNS